MEAPTPPAPNSSWNTNPRKKSEMSSQFCCQRCNRYFSNLQGFNHHQYVHVREEIKAMLRHQVIRSAMGSYIHRLAHSIRLQHSSIPRRRFQPRFRFGPEYAQTMNALVYIDGLIINVSYRQPNFSSSLINNGINLNVGVPGNMIHTMVARSVIPNPNLIMPAFVPTSNYYGNVTMIPTPSAREVNAGDDNRMATIVDGPNGIGAGEENANQDLDLNLHL